MLAGVAAGDGPEAATGAGFGDDDDAEEEDDSAAPPDVVPVVAASFVPAGLSDFAASALAAESFPASATAGTAVGFFSPLKSVTYQPLPLS